MSFRIINDTKKPDHDKKYKTTRAGIQPENENKIKKLKIIIFFWFLSILINSKAGSILTRIAFGGHSAVGIDPIIAHRHSIAVLIEMSRAFHWLAMRFDVRYSIN